ncbi:hypothetical protein [Paenibacillus kobensis]|uniref:hypothetical protein n=1 Tax=Paenibacillus kobensis TaxID=59841 RepID=UPI000FD75A53|nr:hypothetical protein [Paenibacillus kobensis]
MLKPAFNEQTISQLNVVREMNAIFASMGGQLLEEKQVYEHIGRSLRPKDVESIELLSSIIAEGV